jgi:cell pole-organizing protein PopZ
MNDSNDISNNSGPGSTAEPSMEEILASIRRILKEDEGARVSMDEDDDDVLLLDASMIVTPANISTATELLPVDTGLIAAHDAGPGTTYHEPVHFSSEPALETQGLEAEPADLAETYVSEAYVSDPYVADAFVAEAYTNESVAPEPEYVPMPSTQKKETIVEEHVQLPESLVSETARNDIASSVGSLVQSISQERAVSVSRGGLTIEDIVREEIKPVLKAWLDTHLPSLVERIVRAEIGRVIDRTQA